MLMENSKLIDLWLKTFNSECTKKSYHSDIKQFLTWFKNKNILSVREKDIRNYILDLLEQGIIKRTRNRRLSTLKSFYRWLWENHKLKENPAERIRVERLNDSEKAPKALEERDGINLLSIIKTNTITGIRNYAMIYLLLGTGLRREELANLDLEDVYLSKTRLSTITILIDLL